MRSLLRIILSIPKVYLILHGIPRLLSLLSKSATAVPLGVMYYSKLGLAGYIVLLSLTRVFYTLYQGFDQAHLLNSLTDLLVLTIVFFLEHLEHVRSRIASTCLLFFWLMEMIVQSITLRTHILSGLYSSDPFSFAINAQYLFIATALFVLENIVKPRAYYSSLDEDEHTSPEEYTSVFGRLTFHWMDPMMKLGYKKVLGMDDLWNLKHSDTAEFNSEKFQNAWTEELSKKKPRLVRACARSYGGVFLSAAIFKFAQDILSFVQPQLLKAMVFLLFKTQNGRWNLQKVGLLNPFNQNPSSRDFSLLFQCSLRPFSKQPCCTNTFICVW